jgi:hypothetical protein
MLFVEPELTQREWPKRSICGAPKQRVAYSSADAGLVRTTQEISSVLLLTIHNSLDGQRQVGNALHFIDEGASISEVCEEPLRVAGCGFSDITIVQSTACKSKICSDLLTQRAFPNLPGPHHGDYGV